MPRRLLAVPLGFRQAAAMPVSRLSPADQAAVIAITGPWDELRANTDGTAADVLHINGTWVLRQARQDAAAFDRETALLTRLAARLPPALAALLPVPKVSGPGWHLCRHLPGVPSSRQSLAALSPQARGRFFNGFSTLLAGVHTSPEGDYAAATPHSPDQWAAVRAEAEARLFPLLSPALAADLRAALAEIGASPLAMNGPALIHDDLHPAHILHDPATGALTGLLDFGRSGRGDAAVDLAGLLYNWGQATLRALDYPGLADLLPRARRLARTYELQWALEGLRHNDPRWFLYALGAAKDF
ncbi:hypothetical protein CHR90_10820 [Elstera cyanobacteriorum]|uniref:Aminoglycoside phosphotransferase domain-containing protein n=2 Tax=Elstera cyanobacteriorum TaxID=2022747 RepID=A0A255XP31_9PROT|nr:hypothetical protein CHR90_10820 [Elstera cyanobacteriorum]